MSEMTFLRGIPASGKSTYAQQWVSEDPANRVRINRDAIREALFGDAQSHKDEGKVTEVENMLIAKGLKEGKHVMSDNTNTNMAFLPKAIKFAKANGATKINHEDFPITVEEAIKRNSKRENPVPEHVLHRMSKNLGPQGQFPVFPGSYKTKDLILPKSRKLAVCFDMDGTLNDVRNVRHFLQPQGNKKRRDFDSFHRMSEFEPAHEDVLQMAFDAHKARFEVLITTARSEPYRETTQKWLDDRDVPFANIFMRKEGDFRSDYEVKKEMYDQINMYYDVVRCVDDNPQAIKAWREKGVAVTTVPFIDDSNMDLQVKVPNIFRSGACIRCGKPLSNGGPLGPTCKLRAN
jgi:predicted kinase